LKRRKNCIDIHLISRHLESFIQKKYHFAIPMSMANATKFVVLSIKISGANPTTFEFTATTPALWQARAFLKVD
jgi:hypothetical protein